MVLSTRGCARMRLVYDRGALQFGGNYGTGVFSG
jgi:hypothetical protein